MNHLILETNNRIGTIILNRPEKRNALNSDLVNQLTEAISSFEENQDVRALIIKSSGNVFCAGADLGYLQQLQNFTYKENLQDSQNLARLFKTIYNLQKPVISIVEGAAIAGGCGLATICDLCFATPSSNFGYTEARLGFVPAIVMVFLMKNVGETIGKKILFSGEIFSAQKALQYGLITEIIEDDIIQTYVYEWVTNLINNSSGNSISMIKRIYSQIDGLSLHDSIELACRMNADARETKDFKQGITAFLNKEKKKW